MQVAGSAARIDMVDVKTAMAAARAEGEKRRKEKAGDSKGRRLPLDQAIEPFNPDAHASKEHADKWSMWLVLGTGLFVAVVMRMGLMPLVEPGSSILWMLPVLLAVVIPTWHKLVLPERLHEHYTKGTWFRAIMLYVFTWLAFSFLLTNPPFADVAAAEPTDWAIVVETPEGHWDVQPRNQSVAGAMLWTVGEGQTETNGSMWLVYGIRDNADVDAVRVSATHMGPGSNESLDSAPGGEAWEELTVEWQRVVDDGHGARVLQAELGVLGLGTHTVTLVLVEDGSPYVNTSTWVFTIQVVEQIVPDGV